MDVGKFLPMRDGTPIHYRLWRTPGKRRGVILLLHGMGSNLTRWSEFYEHTTLKREWDIVRVDLRGHGESFTRSSIGTEIWCEDLLTILDTEGFEQAVLIGHSLGAHVAAHFAAHHPTRLQGLVLIDPAFHSTLRGGMRKARALKPLLWLALGCLRFANALGLRRRAIAKRDLRLLDERTRAELLHAGNTEEFVRRYSSIWADLKYFPTAHYLKELIEMLRPFPSLSGLPVPILVLLSGGLTYTDPEKTKRILTACGAEIAIIDAYHWPLTEKPVEVRAALEQWCMRLLP